MSSWTLFLSLVVLIACIVVPGGEIPTPPRDIASIANDFGVLVYSNGQT
jgi:hypothetical protein